MRSWIIGIYQKKMLESRSEDALVLLVKLVKSTVEIVETEGTVLTEDLKKAIRGRPNIT